LHGLREHHQSRSASRRADEPSIVVGRGRR
jgi:hypothetical protein